MITSALAVYGSRTSIIIFNSLKNCVEEYTLRIYPDKEIWELS